jgi:hypothetical protein
MKKYLFTLIFLGAAFISLSQIEKRSTQIGISALPVFDAFNLFPKNSISGVAVIVNLGYFPAQDLAVGISPYYAKVRNSYYYPQYSGTKNVEDIQLFGMNIYTRYYFLSQKRISIYPLIAAGFGNIVLKKAVGGAVVQSSTTSAPALSFTGGLGLNCSLTQRIALELNAPYLYVKSVTNTLEFKTFAPTLGFQFTFD